MKKGKLFLLFIFSSVISIAQTNPVITFWLINTTNIMGRHYVSGNYTPINDNVLANVQMVRYSTNWVYVNTNGIPSYVTGPFLDGNPSLASSQNAIFKIPLNPTQNTGTPTSTTGGNIGIFINGVALFDYRDGVSWQFSSSSLKGGPLGGSGDGVWNRDAVVAERNGFDCAKGHPAMGNYHHHQNPSAFKLDLSVISTICNLYNADGLYVIDSTKHSPLIGFAYDGFPIYGAYGYRNVNGSGGITRMKSSYAKRNITVRTHYADGTNVTDGPAVSTTYPLGYFREDYQYNATSAATPDYLDSHNGRFCVTPEFPSGTYAYFATVDANWNSAYPYAVGPTFYGIKSAVKVTTITETVTTYTAPVVTALNLKLFFEGMYISGGEMNPALYNSGFGINARLVDTITVELRQTSSPFALVESAKAILKIDGTATLSFSSSRTGNSYYIIVKHRNAMETWSANPMLMAASTTYDFSNNQSKAYGNNMKQTSDASRWAFISGDVSSSSLGIGHQDGIIESQDYSDLENAVQVVLAGYQFEDITGDGLVESDDYSVMENNLYFVFISMHP